MSNGRRRLINIVLVCSLAINLLLVGGIIGRILLGPPPPPLPDNLGWIVRNMDQDTRRALRPELEAHIREVLPLRRQMRAAQREFESAVTSPELDEDRLAAALTRLRDISESYQQSMHEEMISIFKKMDAADRERVVRFLRQREEMRRGRNRERPPPNP
jgi:uncharacterized membrane protein